MIYNKTGKYNTIVPLKKIPILKDQYDKLNSSFFARKVQLIFIVKRKQPSLKGSQFGEAFGDFREKKNQAGRVPQKVEGKRWAGLKTAKGWNQTYLNQ